MKPALPTLHSPLVRLLNRVGSSFASRVEFSSDYLLDQARLHTRLDDFGEDDFRRPLEVLLESLDKEAQLHLVGRKMTQLSLLRSLINRLRIQRHVTVHPEVDKVRLAPPVVITGAPRTGTTLVQRLLGADPGNRVFRTWELLWPVAGIPKSRETEDDRRRQVVGRHKLSRRLMLSRNGRRHLDAVHDSTPDDPEECWPLFQNMFLSDINGVFNNVPSYSSYLANRDLTDAYHYYRRQLQILTTREPARRIVLKYPGHLGRLRELFAVFPDARVIWCHRSPTEVVPSACSLAAAYRSLRSDHLDPRKIGEWAIHSGRQLLSKGIAARRQLAPEHFFDVYYADLVADPIGMVRRIYEFLGFDVTEQAERSFAGWLDASLKRRERLRHKYSPEIFGLDAATITSNFSEYSEAFDVP